MSKIKPFNKLSHLEKEGRMAFNVNYCTNCYFRKNNCCYDNVRAACINMFAKGYAKGFKRGSKTLSTEYIKLLKETNAYIDSIR